MCLQLTWEADDSSSSPNPWACSNSRNPTSSMRWLGQNDKSYGNVFIDIAKEYNKKL